MPALLIVPAITLSVSDIGLADIIDSFNQTGSFLLAAAKMGSETILAQIVAMDSPALWRRHAQMCERAR